MLLRVVCKRTKEISLHGQRKKAEDHFLERNVECWIVERSNSKPIIVLLTLKPAMDRTQPNCISQGFLSPPFTYNRVIRHEIDVICNLQAHKHFVPWRQQPSGRELSESLFLHNCNRYKQFKSYCKVFDVLFCERMLPVFNDGLALPLRSCLPSSSY